MKNCNGEKHDTEYYNLIAHKGRSEIKLWHLRVIQFLSRLHVQGVNYKAKTLDSLIFQCNSLEIKILNTFYGYLLVHSFYYCSVAALLCF